jgi:hypothetical protein
VLIAGKFSGPGRPQKNLVLVKDAGPNTGRVIQWYDAPSLKSALAAPDLGRVYGGGVGVSVLEVSGKKLWTRAKTTVDTTLYPDAPSPGYRDLELDGKTIWAACACDAVAGRAAKALAKLDLDGNHDASWRAAADRRSWGMSVVKANGALYLGTGGTHYLAKFSKADGRNPTWERDTTCLGYQLVTEPSGRWRRGRSAIRKGRLFAASRSNSTPSPGRAGGNRCPSSHSGCTGTMSVRNVPGL